MDILEEVRQAAAEWRDRKPTQEMILQDHPSFAEELTRIGDEIERLRADRATYNAWAEEIKIGIVDLREDNERLRAALDPFVRHAHCVDQIERSSLALWCAQALNAVHRDDEQ